MKHVYFMRSFTHWFRGGTAKGGPEEGIIVLLDGSFVWINYLDPYGPDGRKKVKDIDHEQIIGTARLVPATGCWSGDCARPFGLDMATPSGNANVIGEWDTQEEAAQGIYTGFMELLVQETEISKSHEAQLERELKQRDWYAAYSDMPGVDRANQEQWNRIKNIVAKMPDKDRANDLYDQYAPSDFENRTPF